jgi:hypothetical protein
MSMSIANTDAAERMEPLRTLAAGLANEVNSPLTSLLANLEHVVRRLRAIAARELDEECAMELPLLVEALARALDAGDRVRQLTRDLMTFSQVAVERRELVDPRSVVEAALHIAAPEIRARARMVRALGEAPPVEADEGRLTQALVAILENGAEAIPEGNIEGNEVRVATGTDAAGRAVIEVSDTGAGMAPDVMARVFEPFYTARPGRGRGLGLSVAYGIVAALDGELTIDSEEGEGCTVTMTLPAARSMTREPLRVLLLADERPAGDALALALSNGHDAIVADDAQDALAKLDASAFDAIVCDALPPGMCLVELFSTAVRRDPHLSDRFVFLSGGKVTERAQRLLEGMRVRCLEKPPDLARLRELIRYAGARPR